METKVLRLIAVLLLMFSLFMPTVVYAFGDVAYTNTRWLADNLEYVNTIKWDETFGRMESFALRLTGQGDAYPIVLNGETVYGGTRISQMVSFAEEMGKNVLAVVNTDFFYQYSLPIGILIEDGVWKSSPNNENAVVFAYDGSVRIIESPTVSILLFNEGGAPEANNAGKSVRFEHLNKMRTERGGLVLYSEAFSTVSTRTASPGWFVRFKILEGIPSVSGTMLLEVTETLESEGAIPIGEGYLVLSAAQESEQHSEFEKFAVGDIVTLRTSCNDMRLLDAQYATGGGDILIARGEITDQDEWSPALIPRAPRTAFGLLADGTVIAYVADGRNSEHSVGLTLSELAEELYRLGCVYAVNFDGGGSSAISLRVPGEDRARLINRPSDGTERNCATYILYVTDAIPDGAAKNLRLVNDGAILLSESSLDLTYAATDSGYMPADLPDDVFAAAMDPGAFIDGATYTAGLMAVTDRISLYSPSTGAFGVGEIYVITRPTSITAYAKGSTTPLTSMRIAPGAVIEFDTVATYYRRSVVAQAHSFEYLLSGDIGEMIGPAVFQAGAKTQQRGTITIAAGGRSTVIQVEINGFADMDNHWAKEYAEQLLQMGITQGVTESDYGPSELMRRADYILMLYRAAGQPQVSVFSEFDDVPPDMYYTQALTWASLTGIAEGLDGNNFYPQLPITRQDAFTFTYRALAILGKDYPDGYADDLEAFPDSGYVDDYAVIPIATLMRLGIVEGMDGILSPHSTLTRAQMAKVLATVIQLR